MKHQVYFGIAFRIILLIAIGMFTTFITPELRDFFDDTHVPNGSDYDKEWTWGARHYWYFWGMIALFFLSLVNTIMACVNLVDKYYYDQN